MRKSALYTYSSIAIVAISCYVAYRLTFSFLPDELQEAIKVGILHSGSGPLAAVELPSVEVTKMAIEELNARGGLLGRQIEVVESDCESRPERYAEEAERLISDEGVSVLFGGWLSDGRKTTVPVIEDNSHLLYYPVSYEGIEQSDYLVYTGAAPNQQILTGLRWSVLKFGKRVFLVSPDDVYGHTATAILRDQLAPWRGEILGEEYVLIGAAVEEEPATEESEPVDPRAVRLAAIVEKIREAAPDVILNNLSGESYRRFILALRDAGITPGTIPQMSFAISEVQLQQLSIVEKIPESAEAAPTTEGTEKKEDAEDREATEELTFDYEPFAGDYTVASYFQGLDNESNKQFIERFRERFGATVVTDDTIEAHYSSVYLWAEAVRKARSFDVDAVRKASTEISFRGPSGPLYVDPDSRHTWRQAYVGQIRDDGQIEILWDSGRPLRPMPYPELRSRAKWEQGLRDLFQAWGESWANPTSTPSRAGSSFRLTAAQAELEDEAEDAGPPAEGEAGEPPAESPDAGPS